MGHMAAVKDKAGNDVHIATDARDVFVFNARDAGVNRIQGAMLSS
jgi:hypothetical protein